MFSKNQTVDERKLNRALIAILSDLLFDLKEDIVCFSACLCNLWGSDISFRLVARQETFAVVDTDVDLLISTFK